MLKCIFNKHDIFNKNGLNVDNVMKKLLDNKKAKLNDKTYVQVKALLLTCKKNSIIDVADCLIKNNDRFGLTKMLDFDINLKLKFSLSDLLNSPPNVTDACKHKTTIPLKYTTDVFVSL